MLWKELSAYFTYRSLEMNIDLSTAALLGVTVTEGEQGREWPRWRYPNAWDAAFVRRDGRLRVYSHPC
ncbi:hypothetical protein AB1N83_008213 [Pleurotus pulmonarius]